MDLETVLKKARETKAEIDAEYINSTAWRLDDADFLDTYIAYIKRLARIIETKANILGFYVDHYNARRDYPQKAAALDLCDGVLQKLDTLRDLIARAVEGDDAVKCDEIDAKMIIGQIEIALDSVEAASVFAKKNRRG